MELTLLKEKILKGSLAGLLRTGLAIPIYIILTPLMLHKLGPELFGIWSLSTIIIGLINLADFGFKSSLVFYVARDLNQPEEINQHFNAVFWVFTAMFLITLLVILAFGNEIGKFLLVPEKFHNELFFTLTITVLSFGLRLLSVPFQALFEGHQETYVAQMVYLFWLIVHSIGVLGVLLVKPNIYALGIVGLISNALVWIVFFTMSFHRFPYIRVKWIEIKKDKIQDLVRYGLGIQVASLFIILKEPVYKIAITRLYGLSAVASFEVVYKLSVQLMSILSAPQSGVMAASAMLTKREDDFEKIVKPLMGFTLFILIPAILFFESFSSQLVKIWLGGDSAMIGRILPLFFMAFATYYTTEILYKSIEGAGLSNYSAMIQMMVMLVHLIVLSLLASNPFISIPVSLFAGFLFFSVCNVFVFRWKFKQTVLIQPNQLLQFMIPSCGFLLIQLWFHSGVILVLFFMVYLVVHFLVAKMTGIFNFFGLTKRILLFGLNRK
jgi:O-antigen/teichoic acid export membrane protein